MEGFKPFGVHITDLEPVILLYEEYESVRLSDYMGLTQLQSAVQMNVSRPTFTRIYEKARRTIAQAFVEGKAIFIEGGNYHTDDCWYKCENCQKLSISQNETITCNYCHSTKLRRLNKKNETVVTPDFKDYCICVHCNVRTPHVKGKPCNENVCPQCGKKIMREGSYHHQLYQQKKGEIKNEISSTDKG
jgi:predicted DNA-binding protein (UPF0251 family)